jgi:hypothetical protein
MGETTVQAPPVLPRWHVSTALRIWGYGGLAMAWYAVTTFTPLGLPNFAVAFVLGLLVMLSAAPDSWLPERGVAASRRNVILALLAVIAFIPVALGMDLLLGRIPIESGHAVIATSAAVAVLLPRLAETRELHRPAVLGHRELIISVTALVTFARSYQSGASGWRCSRSPCSPPSSWWFAGSGAERAPHAGSRAAPGRSRP